MAHGLTTSVRLPTQVRRQLERISHKIGKGKNGIVVEALNDYFDKIRQTTLEKEAKAQSLLASRKGLPDDAAWEENLDLDDWKG